MAFFNACNLSLNRWFVEKKQPENIYFRENSTSYFLKKNLMGFGLERRHKTNTTKMVFQSPSSPRFLPDAGEQVNLLSHQRCKCFQTLTFQSDFPVLMLTKARFVLVSVLKNSQLCQTRLSESLSILAWHDWRLCPDKKTFQPTH